MAVDWGTIASLATRAGTGTWIVTVSHHWNLDRPDPR
jgi:hypothetical protein